MLLHMNRAAATPPLPGISLAARAYAEIRDRILKGELPAGTALSRRKLAEEMHFSVPPVTEALQNLERDGLVESRPRVGTRVRIPTRQDVEDRSLVREALEMQAARLFAERAKTTEKRELQQMGRDMDQLYTACEKNSNDREFLFSVNLYHMRFHMRIAECARCPALRDAIEKEQVLIFNWFFDTAAERRLLGSDFHTRLTRVLVSGTSEEAADAMRQHIRRGLNDVLERMAKPDGAPKDAWRSTKVQSGKSLVEH
jgi:DNA-binding GntR family transcriptional regulator